MKSFKSQALVSIILSLLIGIPIGCLIGLSKNPILGTFISILFGIVTPFFLLGFKESKDSKIIFVKAYLLIGLLWGVLVGSFAGIRMRQNSVIAFSQYKEKRSIVEEEISYWTQVLTPRHDSIKLIDVEQDKIIYDFTAIPKNDLHNKEFETDYLNFEKERFRLLLTQKYFELFIDKTTTSILNDDEKDGFFLLSKKKKQ